MSLSKVSIMIPTYNQSEFIEQTIESALDQNYTNIEIIISDDSIDDKTEKIVKQKYINNPKVKYIHNNPSLGRVGNYHKLLYELTSGDYVLNLDGDDWLIDKFYITDAVKILDQNSQINAVFANVKIYDSILNNFIKRENRNDNLNSILTGTDFYYEYVVNNISFNHLTLLYRRDEAMKVGFYEKDIIYSDGYSFAKLIYSSSVAFINRETGVWRQHTTNTSSIVSYDNLNNLKIGDILETVNLIIDYYNGKEFKELSYKQWSLKYKITTLYPYISKSIKHKNLYGLFAFLKKIYQYDKSLFLNILQYMIQVPIMQLKKKIIHRDTNV